ncbi:class I SAM-dependent methyltransferase [Paenibacillus sp. GYB003]|uniref:class I SAM-dependent methyltransferase n=1 Tax=Paenibacillus sp. GYB003 TaxID=2994392 RepID=UPI002F965F02
MSYVLENDKEFERLERQSQLVHDCRKELQDVDVRDGAHLLDAGCGSGAVSRYLAERFPSSRVVGCDYTASLLAQAREVSRDISNLVFEKQDLKQLSYPDGQFDLIVTRFVLQHQDSEGRCRIIAELARVLKPGGELVVIESDGSMLHLYPQTPIVTEGLRKLAAVGEVDVQVGRKIPYLLAEAGFSTVSWRMETVEFQGEIKHLHIGLAQERFHNGGAFFERVIGGKDRWRAFSESYLACMEHPQSVYFYHKFIVRAVKTK